MKGVFTRTHVEDQNIPVKRIIQTSLGLTTLMIFLGGYANFSFSQAEQLDLFSSNNETRSSSNGSSQSSSGFVMKGTINTLITVPNGKWIASGNWSLILNNDNVTTLETKMTWYNSSGTNAHTHELTNFRNTFGNTELSPVNATAKQIILNGVTDLGANGKVSWTDIPTTITINDRKIISIEIDDTKTNHHFGGQPLLGIVDSFVPCSDLPGPNMELLPPCAVDAAVDEASSEGLLPYQEVYPGGEFPQQGFPDQGFPDQGFPDQGFPDQGFPDQGFPDQDLQGGGFPSDDDDTQGGFPTEDDNLPRNEINPQCDDLTIQNVTASGFESDPSDYHPPSNAFDDTSSTWWSDNGNDPWVQIDLGETQKICGLTVQWNKGDSRDYTFNIEVSQDGNNYEKVFEGNNNKGLTEPETYVFEEETNGKFIRLTTTDTSSGDGWVSIQELGLLGMPLQ